MRQVKGDWVPFYRSLREGDKRGLPRAVRFVFLELCQEARAYGGRLPLPKGFKNDLDAVHDMLGGNRREVADALRLLTEQTAEQEPLLRFENELTARFLVICSFQKWVRVDNSLPRVRSFREKQLLLAVQTSTERSPTDSEACNALQAPENAPRNALHDRYVTPMKRVTSPLRNGDVTVQSRVEKRKERPPITPQGGTVGIDEKKRLAPGPDPGLGLDHADRTDPPPQPADAAGPPRSRSEIVDAVHRRYLEIRREHRPKSRSPKLKSAERARAEKLLRDGYTQAELELACEGLFRSPHHLGQNDRSTEYLEFFHALSDKCIDGFIAAAEKAREEPPPRSPRPPTVYGPPAPAPPDLAEAIRAFASGGIWTNPEPTGAPPKGDE